MSDQPPSNNNTQPGAATEAQTHVLTSRVPHLFTRMFAAQQRNIKNLSALVIFNFIAQGIFFLTQVKIANVLGISQYGLYAFAMVLGLYGQSFVIFGADRTLVRDIVQQPEREAEILAGNLVIRNVLIVVMLLILCGWSLLTPEMTLGMVIIVVANALKSLDLQGVYDARRQMGRHSIYFFIQRMTFAAIIWGVVLWNPTALNLLVVGGALLFAQLLDLTLQYQWVLRRMRLPRFSSALKPVIMAQLRSGVWLWIAAFVAMVMVNANQVVLKHLANERQLGLYAAAYQLVTIFYILVNQLARVGSPATAKIAEPETPPLRRVMFLSRYLLVMTICLLPICLGIYLFPDAVVHTFFDPEYQGAGSILKVLCIYAILFAWGTVLVQYLVSAKKEGAYFTCLVLSAGLAVAVSWALIPQYGALGAAWALTSVYSLNIVIYVIIIARQIWSTRRNVVVSAPREIPV